MMCVRDVKINIVCICVHVCVTLILAVVTRSSLSPAGFLSLTHSLTRVPLSRGREREGGERERGD